MSMDRDESVMLRVGRPGAGKSHSFTRYLVDEYLANHDGPVYTNVPLKVEACIEYCAKRYRLDDEAKAAWRERIRLFPDDVVQSWLEGHDTPETYFAKLYEDRVREALAGEGYDEDDESEAAKEIRREVEDPLARALVCIDEAGKMWPNSVEEPRRKERAAELARWVRTIRHHGCKLIFVVQDDKQLSANVRRLAGVMLECVNIASRREPITGALIGDWLQLKALIFRRYLTYTQEIEYIKEGDKWQPDHQTIRPLSPKYFPLYDSHNNEGKSSGAEEKRQWERFGVFRFLLWLLSRNAINWGWRFSLLFCVVLLVTPPWSLGLRGWNYFRSEMIRRYSGALTMQTGGQAAGPAAADKPSAGAPVTAGGGKLADMSPEQLRRQVEALRARQSELEQRLGASSDLVYVDQEGAITDDGDRWRVGERIEFGRYKGERVRAVDVEAGRVRLDSGLVLRLRRASDEEARAVEPEKPGVAGQLRTGEGRGEGRGPERPQGAGS